MFNKITRSDLFVALDPSDHRAWSIDVLGPQGVYEAWTGGEALDEHDRLHYDSAMLWKQLRRVLRKRDLNRASQKSLIDRAIIGQVEGADDICKFQSSFGLCLIAMYDKKVIVVRQSEVLNCGAQPVCFPSTLPLLISIVKMTSDWHVLFGHFDVTLWVAKLPGDLPRNEWEMDEMLSYIDDPTVFLNEMFDTEVLQELYPSVSDALVYPWNKAKWYCNDCLDAFVKSRILSWLIAKRLTGSFIPEVLYALPTDMTFEVNDRINCQ